jgi:hypothetical protein
MASSRSMCCWTVTVRRLGVEVAYRVHLAGTPSGTEIEVEARHLALRSRR